MFILLHCQEMSVKMDKLPELVSMGCQSTASYLRFRCDFYGLGQQLGGNVFKGLENKTGYSSCLFLHLVEGTSIMMLKEYSLFLLFHGLQ